MSRLRLVASRRPAAKVAQDLPGRVVSRCPHYPTAGMRPGATEIEPRNRGSIPRPAGERAHEEQPVQRHLAVEDVASGQGELALQVERAEDLPVDDEVRQVWRVLGQRAD